MDKADARVSKGRGAGPSALGQLLRDRSLRLGGGLAIAVAIPVTVLFYFQFRSLSALSKSSAVVLQQLSKETADGVTETLLDRLKQPYINGLLKVPQSPERAARPPGDPGGIREVAHSETFVNRYYVWSDYTDNHRDEVLAIDRQSNGFVANPPEGAMMVKRFRELAPEKHAISVFEATIDGRRTYFQGQLRFVFPSRDRMTSFVAIRVDAEALRRQHIPRLIDAKLKTFGEPVGFPSLQVTLIDGDGRVVYPADGTRPTRWVDERAFPLAFYDTQLLQVVAPEGRKPEQWRLLAGYGNQTIPDIVAARERPQRAMMAMLAGIMALAVFFITRALTREVRLAELKSNFVSSVSHDLKTPLALIQLFAETLELGRLKNTDRAHEYYRIINSEARKLTRLINNLLDFSKIEAGLRRYRLEPRDLGTLVRRVVESLDSQFRHNQFTVTLNVGDGRRPVMLDPEAAEQALENLISNAMKYFAREPRDRDHRGWRGRIRPRARDGSRHRHRAAAAAADLPQVLPGPDRRGHRPAGTGLGLAIVDHIMRGHGGFVRVDSEPGRGSTFTLLFPVYAGDIASDEKDSGDRGRAADVARSA